MMSETFRLVLGLHIVAGLIGLGAFWTPALARKGGVTHVRVGRVFFWTTCVVAGTGAIMAALLLLNPLAIRVPSRPLSAQRAAAMATEIRLTSLFLFYLVLITFTPVYHGVRVLATRRSPEQLRTPFHTFVHLAAIAASCAMVVLGIAFRQPVFAFMSPIGFLIGFGDLAFARRPYPTPMAWWYEHLGSMLGGGIAFHTAFLVLGAGRLFGLRLDGMTAVIPWIMPTLIGLPASAIWTRYYKRKFKEDGPSSPRWIANEATSRGPRSASPLSGGSVDRGSVKRHELGGRPSLGSLRWPELRRASRRTSGLADQRTSGPAD